MFFCVVKQIKQVVLLIDRKLMGGKELFPLTFFVFNICIFSGSDLYHTCYCLSGLSLFQNGGQDQTPIICGDDENKLVRNRQLILL